MITLNLQIPIDEYFNKIYSFEILLVAKPLPFTIKRGKIMVYNDFIAFLLAVDVLV